VLVNYQLLVHCRLSSEIVGDKWNDAGEYWHSQWWPTDPQSRWTDPSHRLWLFVKHCVLGWLCKP